MIVTTRMNRILEVDLEERIAWVEPGVLNLDLTRSLLPKGVHFAPDPSSQQACSIGGNVAHAQPDLVAQMIAAAIPLAVLAMLEGLKGDAGEVTRLAAQAVGLEHTGVLQQSGQGRQATTVRRPDRTATPTNPAAVGAQRRALPAGPRSADITTVGARLQAAYAQPRPDGQTWTARTLAEAAGCGRSSAASFLQRQRPSTAEDAR